MTWGHKWCSVCHKGRQGWPIANVNKHDLYTCTANVYFYYTDVFYYRENQRCKTDGNNSGEYWCTSVCNRSETYSPCYLLYSYKIVTYSSHFQVCLRRFLTCDVLLHRNQNKPTNLLHKGTSKSGIDLTAESKLTLNEKWTYYICVSYVMCILYQTYVY